MRGLLRVAAPRTAALVAVAGLAAGVAQADAGGVGLEPVGDRKPVGDRNPCAKPAIRKQRGLRCPDLAMSRPADIYPDTKHGVKILRATNSINNVGRGPAELRGRRIGPRGMRARQQIHKRGGGVAKLHTGARLYFKRIPGQGRYWKFHNAARFELWSLDRDGRRKRLVTVGPKQDYCLRDLVHTFPGMPHSPSNPVYPSCSQDPRERHVTLGTSVGWSDVYPSSYHEQYVKLNRIRGRGCYSLAQIADPNDKLLELNEKNNAAAAIFYLTRRGGYRPGRCDHVRDRGLPPGRSYHPF